MSYRPRAAAAMAAEETAEARVYVNNMNTPQPTVTIPVRGLHNAGGGRAAGGFNSGRHASNSCGFTGGGGGEFDARARGGAATVSYSDYASGAVVTTPVPTAASASPGVASPSLASRTAEVAASLHPSLEGTYTRIMRRLQRQLNYEDIDRTSLAEQYGVTRGDGEEVDDEEEQQQQKEDAHLRHRHGPRGSSSSSSSSSRSDDDEGERFDGNRGSVSRSSASLVMGLFKGAGRSPSAPFGGDDAAAATATAAASTTRGKRNGCTNTAAAAASGGSGNHTHTHTHTPVAGGTTVAAIATATANQSMLVRYGRRQASSGRGGAIVGGVGGPTATPLTDSHNNALTTSSGGGGGGGNADEDLERALATQPCPRTLRLVVGHVQETVSRKMAMAERGSLRDCLRLTFECRALLDRLLKEAPSYTAFPGNNSDGLESLPVGSGGKGLGTKLHDMFHEFRKTPVLLPRSRFVQDAQTGAVGAELDTSQMAALSGGGGGINHHLPSLCVSTASSGGSGYHLQQQQQQQQDSGDLLSPTAAVRRPTTALPPTALNRAATPTPAPVGGGGSAPPGEARRHHNSPRESVSRALVDQLALVANGVMKGATGAAEAALPTTYGRSARLGKPKNNDSDNGGGGGSFNRSAASTLMVADGGNISSVSGGYHLTAASSSPPLDSPHASQYDDNHNDDAATAGHGRNHPDHRQHYHSAIDSRAAARVSVGTLTDENGSNIVLASDYAALEARAAGLAVALAEANTMHGSLVEKLGTETEYTDSRQRVIQYLRRTLFRECNMLRSQLSFAAQKEAQFTRERQQHLAALSDVSNSNASNYNNGGGGVPTTSPSRSGASAPGGGGGGNRTRAGGAVSFRGRSGIASSVGSGGTSFTIVPPSPTAVSVANINEASATVVSSNSISGRSGFAATPAATATIIVAAASTTVSPIQLGGGHASYSQQQQPGSPAVPLASHDITSIESVLDLVLLAVEKEEVFPSGDGGGRDLATLRAHGGTAGPDAVKVTMTKDLKHQGDELRADFEGRRRRLQDSVMTQKIRNYYTVVEKEKEIERLRKLTNLTFVAETMQDSVDTLRLELRRVKNSVADCLQGYQVTLTAANTSILNRAKLMDQTASSNAAMQNSHDALKDLVESAYGLLTPLLTSEYRTSGYHPWPVKLRNSTEPLRHIIQGRYGAAEVVRLREQLDTLSDVYINLHRFISKSSVEPDMSRPSTGDALRELCGRLVLSTASRTDVIFEVRQRHDREVRLQRGIARLNFKILWNIHLQRSFTERSVGAITCAGMDPYTTTLPVGRRVNELAAARGALTHERNALLKERQENAKHVYRLWREKGIDVHCGFAPPAATGPKLAVLAEARGVRSANGTGPAAMPPPSQLSLSPKDSGRGSHAGASLVSSDAGGAAAAALQGRTAAIISTTASNNNSGNALAAGAGVSFTDLGGISMASLSNGGGGGGGRSVSNAASGGGGGGSSSRRVTDMTAQQSYIGNMIDAARTGRDD